MKFKEEEEAKITEIKFSHFDEIFLCYLLF